MSDLIHKLKMLFPATEHDAIERFASQPEFVAAAERVEEEQLAERRELLAQHAALPGEFDQRQRDARAAERAATENMKALEAQLREAEQRHQAAYAAMTAVSMQFTNKTGRLEQQIRQTAHPLIAETVSALRDASAAARHLLQIGVAPQTHGGRGALYSNADAVNAAMAACSAAQGECEKLVWRALTGAEVKVEIERILQNAAHALRLIGAEAPLMTADGIKMGRPPVAAAAPRAALPGTTKVAPPEQRSGLARASAAIRGALS